MSPVQHLVSPRLPTALATHSHVELPGHDLIFVNINNVHVLPTELNILKFNDALAKALQLYPHAAGQLRCSDGRWFIELTNTGAPVEIDYRLDTSSDSLLNGDWVIQDDISPFLNHTSVGTSLVNNSGPLLRLRLTFFNNGTCIGISWHHTLGDAIVLSRFTHTLSQLYQGLPPKYAAPTFKKHHFPPPPSAIKDELWPHMLYLHTSRPLAEVEKMFAEWYKNGKHLKWRFDDRDLAELRSTLAKQKGTYLSKQDCLTAYIVVVLNHNRHIPVQHVLNTSSSRNIIAAFVDEDLAGNMLQDVPATVPTDMAGIAAALRHAFIQCREPNYIYKWLSVASNHMLETRNAGKSYFWTCHDNTIGANSTVRIDWCSAHFGCPAGSRFYTAGALEHHLRCFRSNPIKGEDGVWQASQSVDVAMGVIAELKPKLLQTLALGIQYALDNDRSQTVPFASSQ